METILDHEQFEGAKELAEIGKQIAEGRALLSTLESSKEEFLTTRERDLVQRIQMVVVGSQELIRQIGTNHDKLVEYRREVTAYVADLRYFVESVTAWKEAIDAQVKTSLETLDKKAQEVTALIEQERHESTRLESERGMMAAERKSMIEETQKFQSERGTLDRAWQELKKKQK